MIARRIEQLEVVDGLADVLQAGAAKVVPPDSPLKRFKTAPGLVIRCIRLLVHLVTGSRAGAGCSKSSVGARAVARWTPCSRWRPSCPSHRACGVADWSYLEEKRGG